MTEHIAPGITIVDGGTLPPPEHVTAAFTATHPAALANDGFPAAPERADEDADTEATP